MSNRSGKVCVLGAFPPPLGGAAKNTKIIFEELQSQAIAAFKLSTSTSKLAHTRSAGYHFGRILKNIWILLRGLTILRKDVTLYVVPDGGLGSWYTLLHLSAGRALTKRQFIHHRTFKYIDSEALPVKLFTRLTRKTATHIFLSQGMAEQFVTLYGDINYAVATNARFVSARTVTSSSRSGPEKIVLGHLSNLCRDKGFFEVVRTFKLCLDRGLECRLLLAGPVLEPEVGTVLEQLRIDHPDLVEYIGPVGAEDKYDVYKRIDVFLFPTQFDLEAQPNVVYESFSCGVPVISIARGCIREMIPEFAGHVVDRRADFPSSAYEQICQIHSGKRSYSSREITDYLSRESASSKKAYELLYRDILSQREY